jgi:hypothetical protein
MAIGAYPAGGGKYSRVIPAGGEALPRATPQWDQSWTSHSRRRVGATVEEEREGKYSRVSHRDLAGRRAAQEPLLFRRFSRRGRQIFLWFSEVDRGHPGGGRYSRVFFNEPAHITAARKSSRFKPPPDETRHETLLPTARQQRSSSGTAAAACLKIGRRANILGFSIRPNIQPFPQARLLFRLA